MRLTVTPEGCTREELGLAARAALFRRYAEITMRLVWFEVKAKQFGRILGLLWLVIDPILFAGLYLFLVMVISGSGAAVKTFLPILIAVTVWRWFSRTVDNAPSIIPSYGGILKQTNFPLSVLLSVFLGVELFGFLLSFVVLFVVLALDGRPPALPAIWVPALILVQGTLMAAIALLAAVVGAFVKDLAGILYVFTSIWWYLSPGIYKRELAKNVLSDWQMTLYDLNPFASIFPAWDLVLFERVWIPAGLARDLGLVFVASLALLAFALWCLARARHRFFRVI